jgi:hypothetical protein
MTRLEQDAAIAAHGPTLDESFDRRWARWQARGVENASRTRHRMVAVAISACVGGAALWAWLVAG